MAWIPCRYMVVKAIQLVVEDSKVLTEWAGEERKTTIGAHLTLALFECQEAATDWTAILSAKCAATPPMTIRSTAVGCFRRSMRDNTEGFPLVWIVSPTLDLLDLHEWIVEKLKSMGHVVRPESLPGTFTGHLTIFKMCPPGRLPEVLERLEPKLPFSCCLLRLQVVNICRRGKVEFIETLRGNQ